MCIYVCMYKSVAREREREAERKREREVRERAEVGDKTAEPEGSACALERPH